MVVYKIRYKKYWVRSAFRDCLELQLPGTTGGPEAPAAVRRSSTVSSRLLCPLSYTLRRCFSGSHARPGSRATFDFPQNSFVWENKKIDSRPPNHKTVLHAFSLPGRGRLNLARRVDCDRSRRRRTPGGPSRGSVQGSYPIYLPCRHTLDSATGTPSRAQQSRAATTYPAPTLD